MKVPEVPNEAHEVADARRRFAARSRWRCRGSARANCYRCRTGRRRSSARGPRRRDRLHLADGAVGAVCRVCPNDLRAVSGEDALALDGDVGGHAEL